MHVAMMIFDYWPAPEGGAERQCRRLVHHLVSEGVTCTVIAGMSTSGLPGADCDGRVPIYRIGRLIPFAVRFRQWVSPFFRWLFRGRDAPFFAMQFWFCLPLYWLARLNFLFGVWVRFRRNHEKFDVLHIHDSGWLAGAGVWLARRWNISVVCKVRNTPALDVVGYDVPLRRTWQRLRMQAYYIVLHAALRDELLAAGISSSKISVIPNGVLIPASMARPQFSRDVLFVGNFSQGASHKGFDILLRAWVRVHEQIPLARLVMVGGGDVASWQRVAQELGCGASVLFCGRVEHPETYYERAGLFVLPSWHEGMSNALLEAQSYGLPAVVSDIPANRAVVVENETALLVRPGDDRLLAEALITLLCDTSRRGVMGGKAREHITRNFSSGFVGGQVIRLYRSLLQKKASHQ